MSTILTWRIDVQFIGDWMAPSVIGNFAVDVGENIRAAPMAAHANSIWEAGDSLTVVSVVGLH